MYTKLSFLPSTPVGTSEATKLLSGSRRLPETFGAITEMSAHHYEACWTSPVGCSLCLVFCHSPSLSLLSIREMEALYRVGYTQLVSLVLLSSHCCTKPPAPSWGTDHWAHRHLSTVSALSSYFKFMCTHPVSSFWKSIY